MSSAISARGLRREYGETVAVSGLDLDIESGTITALVGPNGAGKTTLLRMLSGLLSPTAGRIEVFGLDVAADPRELHARVGFLPDYFGVYEDLTPRQFLRYFARAYRLPEARVEARVVEALAEVGLAEKTDAPVEGLSRGMKQRLGVARTLLHDPPILLLDEPASGLDPGSRRDLQALLARCAARGAAVVVSSHILAELEEYCTRVVILDRGMLVHSGAAAAPPSARRRLRVRVLGEASAALVSGRPGVSDARASGSEIRFAFDGDDAAIAALLRALVESGAKVTGFAEAAEGMQDRYLSLIGSRD